MLCVQNTPQFATTMSCKSSKVANKKLNGQSKESIFSVLKFMEEVNCNKM